MANDKHKMDHIIDNVFYCGVNNVITLAGIVGNAILLVIFMRPHLIRHRSILHTYLKVFCCSTSSSIGVKGQIELICYKEETKEVIKRRPKKL